MDTSPHAKFWRQLLNSRVDLLVGSKTWLRSLRFKNDEVRWWIKKAGFIFEERGLNLYQLIAESYDENWDAEDEEKHCSRKNEVAITQRATGQNDDLVTTCETGTRERQHQLQGKPEASISVVEEDQGKGDQIRGGACKTETEAREKGKGRRDDFYRKS